MHLLTLQKRQHFQRPLHFLEPPLRLSVGLLALQSLAEQSHFQAEIQRQVPTDPCLQQQEILQII